MTSPEQHSLRMLLSSATPFLRILGASKMPWCRVMGDPNDARVGPWQFVAEHEVLDEAVWRRKGEVIYFVTNATGKLRLVGQSMSKLGGRWKTVPMYEVQSKRALKKKALFHTSSWPAIEAALGSNDTPPFTVSALFRDSFEPLCRAATSSLAAVFQRPETHLQRLSYHIETWVCSLDHGASSLWNKQKIAKVTSAA